MQEWRGDHFSRVTATAQTGVEMEALVGVSAAALTVYDMCKALDKGMEITDIVLLEENRRQERPLSARKEIAVHDEDFLTMTCTC